MSRRVGKGVREEEGGGRGRGKTEVGVGTKVERTDLLEELIVSKITYCLTTI